MTATSTVRRLRLLAPLALAGLLPLAACGGDDDGGMTEPPPNQAPTATIDAPADGNGYAEQDTVVLEGSGSDPEDGSLSGSSLTWESSVDGELATGGSGTQVGLSEGDHTIRLIATDSEGVTDTAAVGITALAPGGISLVSGDGQTGRTTREFSDALVVELADSAGDPAAGVEVRWSVSQGGAVLESGASRTNDQGEASIRVTSDTLLESHTVEASADYFSGGPVSFGLETTVAWFEIGDNFFEDWQGRQNTSFEADGNITVGDTVMWEYVTGGSSHTVTSGEGTDGTDGDGVPTGGSSHASGSLSPGNTYTWVPDAAGTWTYYCEVHPSTMYDSVIIVDDITSSTDRAAAHDLEPGDVVQPEGSPLKFVYLGPPGTAER